MCSVVLPIRSVLFLKKYWSVVTKKLADRKTNPGSRHIITSPVSLSK